MTANPRELNQKKSTQRLRYPVKRPFQRQHPCAFVHLFSILTEVDTWCHTHKSHCKKSDISDNGHLFCLASWISWIFNFRFFLDPTNSHQLVVPCIFQALVGLMISWPEVHLWPSGHAAAKCAGPPAAIFYFPLGNQTFCMENPWKFMKIHFTEWTFHGRSTNQPECSHVKHYLETTYFNSLVHSSRTSVDCGVWNGVECRGWSVKSRV